MKILKIDVFGRVQGIGFRKKIRKYAMERDLVGFVRNRKNGSVEIFVKGSGEKLKEFILFLESNPGLSRIDRIEKEVVEVDGEINGFKVLREDNFFYDKFKAGINLVKRASKKDVLNDPRHVAIIPDGNRRWAKEKGMYGYRGHEKAGEVDNLISLFEEARKFGVEYISFWGFSTENWKRTKEENDKLFKVFLKGIKAFKEYAHKNKVRFRHVGRKDRFSDEIREALVDLEDETKKYDKCNVILCLDYGGRDEIIRAVNKLLEIGKEEINEKDFLRALDTKDIPDVDLIIRTSGEKRLSGFMPFQGVYAELIFVDKYFPDFSPKDVRACLNEYANRKRRFGGG